MHCDLSSGKAQGLARSPPPLGLSAATASGAVEAAHTMIVNTRLKRSGQRWGRAGGQGVLTVRARLTSGRFDNVWAQLTHRRRHASACPAAANDNRTPLAKVA